MLLASSSLLGCLHHLAHGVLINCLAVLVDVVHPGRNGLGGRRVQAAAARHIQRRRTGTVYLMVKVDQADLAFFRGFDQDRAGPIAKDDAGCTVGVIDDRRHGVSADDQDLGVNSRLDQLGPHLQGIKKTRAGCGKVEAPGALGAELVLNQAGGRGEEHVRRDSGDDDDLYLAGRDAALGKATARRFNGHVTGRHPWLDQVALADAEALHDPFIRGVYQPFQIGVVEDARRHIGSQSADLGAPLMPADAIRCSMVFSVYSTA